MKKITLYGLIGWTHKRSALNKIMLSSIIALFLISTVHCVAAATDTNTETIKQSVQSIGNDIVTVTPQTIQIGTDKSNVKDVTNGYYTVGTQGGALYFVLGTPYIDSNQIIVATDKSNVKDKVTGQIYNIYKSIVPIQFDVVGYTAFDEKAIAGGVPQMINHPVVIGRGYVGVGTVRAQHDGLERSAIFDYWYGNDKIDCVKRVSQNDKLTHIAPETTMSYKDNIGTWHYYGNDGENGFQTNEYFEWTADVPYYTPDTTKTDYTSILNYFSTYATGTNVDIGKFNLNLGVKLMPVLGLTPSITVSDTATLNLDSSWIGLTGASIVSGSSDSGYTADGTSTIETYNVGYTSSDASKMIGENADAIHDAQAQTMSSSVAEFKSVPNPIVSTITAVAKTYGGYYQPSVGQPTLYSNDLKLPKSGFTQTDSKNILNLLDWQVQLNGIHLAPKVEIAKKTSTIYYQEEWYKSKVLGGYTKIYDDSAGSNNKVDCAGWTAKNTYFHQRISLQTQIFTRYNLDVKQGENAYNDSTVPKPDDYHDPNIWDNSNWGTNNYSVKVTQPSAALAWDDFWKSVLGIPNGGVVGTIIVIALVAVAALVLGYYVYTTYFRGAVGGRGLDVNTQKNYERALQFAQQNANATNQSLMAQIATLQKMVQQAQQPQPQQFVQRLPPTSNIQNQPFMQNPQQQYPQQQVVTKKTGRTTELTGETQIELKNET